MHPSYNTKHIEDDIDMLTRGSLFLLPIDNKMKDLYNGLIDGGFIGRETKAEHFCVVLGRYLYKTETPFAKIRWMKDLQLFKFFLDNICPTVEWSSYKIVIANRLFLNKGKEMSYPKTMNARLITRNGYDMLQELLNDYKR